MSTQSSRQFTPARAWILAIVENQPDRPFYNEVIKRLGNLSMGRVRTQAVQLIRMGIVQVVDTPPNLTKTSYLRETKAQRTFYQLVPGQLDAARAMLNEARERCMSPSSFSLNAPMLAIVQVMKADLLRGFSLDELAETDELSPFGMASIAIALEELTQLGWLGGYGNRSAPRPYNGPIPWAYALSLAGALNIHRLPSGAPPTDPTPRSDP